MLPSSIVMICVVGFCSFGDFGQVVHAEVVRLARANLVALPQEVRDLIFGGTRRLSTDRRHADLLDAGKRLALHLLLDRRVRHHRRVVLILAVRRLSLRRKHADHAVGLVFDSNRLADGIAPGKQVVRDCLSQHHDAGRGADVVSVKNSPCAIFQPRMSM
jgi:hypothetical protein